MPARLTPAGREILRECAGAVADVEQSLALTREQTRQLNPLLHIVANPPAERDTGAKNQG